MREFLELRVNEKYANLIFHDNEGKKLGPPYLVRKIIIERTDKRFNEIGKIQNDLQKGRNKWYYFGLEKNEYFFFGWNYIRRYAKKEIDDAKLFTFTSTNYFEPSGVECGTTYDETTACPKCGSGARQVSPLFIQPKNIPKGKDFVTTIANEILVSYRAVEIFEKFGVTGANYNPVLIKNNGNEIVSEEWFQLEIIGKLANINGLTITGINPFDLDVDKKQRCNFCDLIGLNTLSELYINADSYFYNDFTYTKQYFGIRMGLLRPYQHILISPKIREIVIRSQLKGARLEIAHLV